MIGKIPERPFQGKGEEEKEVAVSEYDDDMDKECPSMVSSYHTGLQVVAPDPKTFNTIHLSNDYKPVQPQPMNFEW